ncbi:MAG: hypothetical protein Q9O74_09545 [Planctomycetota bacterium]|nr:hypothetical protein [Planctomycetota bacterium]
MQAKHRSSTFGFRVGVLVVTAGALLGSTVPAASAQGLGESAAVAPSPTQLKRGTLAKMQRPMPDVNFEEYRLEDVMNFISELTGADIEPLWIDDAAVDGLDPDTLITLKAKRVSALRLLELVLEKAEASSAAFAGGNTWQMTEWGTLECGPKELLARRMRLEVYSITDLLWEIPDYDDAPEINLQTVLQSARGGGGGGSPFNNTQQEDFDRTTLEERSEGLIEIIEALVEPESWLSGGGTSSIRYFQGNLLVRAPDYVHRNLGGYSWWPSAQTSSRVVKGRRYVSIGVDTGIATVDDFAKQPVTGVVGGGGGPGGGGG